MAVIRRSPANQNAMTPVPNTMLPKLGVEAQKPSGVQIGKSGFPQVQTLDNGKQVSIASWAGLKLQSMGKGYIYNPMGSGNYGPRTNIVTDANRYTGPTQIPRIGTKISNTSTYVPGKKFGM